MRSVRKDKFQSPCVHARHTRRKRRIRTFRVACAKPSMRKGSCEMNREPGEKWCLMNRKFPRSLKQEHRRSSTPEQIG